MKTPNVLKTLAISSAIFMSANLQAQTASIDYKEVPLRQKISVDFKITPSVQGFRAGVSLMDSAQNKFRLWVNNSEEKRFTVSISTANGFLWSKDYKDAYFNQVFDLSSLDDGDYFIKINCDKDNFERKIVLSTNSYTRRDLRIE
jgi:hypothetical protein